MQDQLFKQVNWEVERKYGGLAVAIESYVKNYTAENNIEPVHKYIGAVLINAEEAKEILEAHEYGSLEKTLKESNHRHIKTYPDVRKAIISFFEQGKHKEFVPKV